MDTKLFDLENIKEIAKPIEKLQGEINRLDEIYKNFIEKEDSILENYENKDFLIQVQEISQLLKEINKTLIKVSDENVNKFLVFQDNLIKKYKDLFKDRLKNLKLDQNFTKEIGLFLIENKKICKIIERSSFINAISLEQWLDLLDSLKFNSLFLLTIKKCEKFYEAIKMKRLNDELSTIPEDVDPVLIKEFKKKILLDSNLTFKKFLKEIEDKLTKEEIDAKRKIIEKTKEKEKLKKLKQKQEEHSQSYQDYLRLSNKEFERRRRKKKRGKLLDLAKKSNNKKEIKISEEISEKIEKFKSKFENNFVDLLQKDNNKDPLEIIRKRKKKKQEEYKNYIRKIKNKEE